MGKYKHHIIAVRITFQPWVFVCAGDAICFTQRIWLIGREYVMLYQDGYYLTAVGCGWPHLALLLLVNELYKSNHK